MHNDEVCHLLRRQPRDWQSRLAEDVDRRLETETGRIFDEMTAAFEMTVIERALVAADGCRRRAANLLGIGRNTIARKIALLQIDDGRNPMNDEPFAPIGLGELFKEKT